MNPLKKLRTLFGRKAFEAEMEEEMRLHLEERVRQNREAGMSQEEARQAALRKFGGVEQTKELVRDQRGWLWLDLLFRDLRAASRWLARNRFASMLAILSVALGVGVPTAVFSAADAIIFNPYPFEKPEALFAVRSSGPDGKQLHYGWPDFQDMSSAATGKCELGASMKKGFLLSGDPGEELLAGRVVSENFFKVLGVKAVLGRASVAVHEGVPEVVLSHRLWQRRFGADQAIVGKVVRLNRHDCVVAGVFGPDFNRLDRVIAVDVWLGAEALFGVFSEGKLRQQVGGDFQMVARLPSGAETLGVAAALDAAIRGSAERQMPKTANAGTQLRAEYQLAWPERIKVGSVLFLLLGLLLFVACANVAELQIAQAESRKRELGLRLALGAGAWAVARLLLIETALLTIPGAFLGVLLAHSIVSWLNATLTSYSQWLSLGVQIDWRTLVFSMAAMCLTVLFAGIAPARLVFQMDLLRVLKLGQGTARVGDRWQRFIVAGQAAVSVALLGLAVLFLQSLNNAAAVRPGFDPDKNVLVLSIASTPRSSMATWMDQVSARLGSLPGVRGVTFAKSLPLSGSGGGAKMPVEMGHQEPLNVSYNLVGPNYFSLLGTRLEAGRFIEPLDGANSSQVAVVSHQLARKLCPDRNSLGEWIVVGGVKRQIVGIVEDSPPGMNIHEAPQPIVYLPFDKKVGELCLFVETGVAPETLAVSVRNELKRFDPDIVFIQVATLRKHLELARFTDQTMTTAMSWLGGLGFLLTVSGLFGVIQCMVNRRTKEIGVRMALGATQAEIQRMVWRESLQLVSWGLVGGLVLLVLGSYLVRSLVFGVTPMNPWSYLAAVIAAVLTALVSAWLPARRAAKVDPILALRAE